LINHLISKRIKSELAPNITAFISGGAPLNPSIAKFFQKLRIPVLEGYGLTETTGGITVNAAQTNKPGTVGKALKGAEIKIADDHEILCRGTSVFQAYYKNDQANIEAFYTSKLQEYTEWNPDNERDTQKWFRTGDLGAFDNAGYLQITGRKKELIVTSYGKKIAINKIEQMFQTSTLINQIVVFGDNRKYLAALVSIEQNQIPHEKQEALVQAEIDSINKQLANFEQIKKFHILDHALSIEAGELTQTLKIKRNVVAQKYKKLIEQMYDND
jgi:long-chain acyl-CoA synthetase